MDAPLSFVADTLMLPVDALRPKAAETEAESDLGKDVDAACNPAGSDLEIVR